MPRQRSRSPLSPILATESATVRLFFILSVLLCSVNKAGLKTETWLLYMYCLLLRSRSPHNAKHSTSYYAQCARRGGGRRPGNEASASVFPPPHLITTRNAHGAEEGEGLGTRLLGTGKNLIGRGKPSRNVLKRPRMRARIQLRTGTDRTVLQASRIAQ